MRLKRLIKPPGHSRHSFQGRTACNTRGGSTRKRHSKFLKKGCRVLTSTFHGWYVKDLSRQLKEQIANQRVSV